MNTEFIKKLLKKFDGKFVEEYPCKGMSMKNAVTQEKHSGGEKALKSFAGKRIVKKGENNEYYLF